MILFHKPTAQEIWQKFQNEIELPFESSYVINYSFEAFIYQECQNKIAEIQYKIPKYLIDYFAFDLVADDFYNAHRHLLIWKNGFLFRTLKYNISYEKFLKGTE